MTSNVIIHQIMEAITISTIIRASAFAVWFAKARFQPEIERSRIEAPELEEETIVAKRRLSNKIN